MPLAPLEKTKSMADLPDVDLLGDSVMFGDTISSNDRPLQSGKRIRVANSSLKHKEMLAAMGKSR